MAELAVCDLCILGRVDSKNLGVPRHRRYRRMGMQRTKTFTECDVLLGWNFLLLSACLKRSKLPATSPRRCVVVSRLPMFSRRGRRKRPFVPEPPSRHPD